MVSSWLATFQISVLVCRGILGSLLISSSIDIAEAAFTASFTLSSKRMALMFSAERLMFLGTASSLIMRSKTSTHCLRTFSAVVESPPILEDGKKVNDSIRHSRLSSDVIVVVFKRMWQCEPVVKIMDEEEMLERMTKLLEQGCTMLASHHICGAPLFRCKGEIICPVCSLEGGTAPAAGAGAQAAQEVSSAQRGMEAAPAQKEIAGIEAPSERVVPSASPVKQIGKAEAGETKLPDRDELISAKAALRQTLLRRLKDLTEGIESEGDLDKLHRQLACIEGIVNILKALER